ncbi:MAG: hypothetical protein WBM77_17195 [Maribacter sp.]
MNKHNTTDQKALEEKVQKMHTEDLGLGMPEDYFSKSKSEILAKVGIEDKSRVLPLYRNKIFWAAAAAIAVLIVLTVFKTNTVPQIDETPTIVSDTIEQLNEGLADEDFYQGESDILISSLFVEDTELDEFVDNYMLEEAIVDETEFY